MLHAFTCTNLWWLQIKWLLLSLSVTTPWRSCKSICFGAFLMLITLLIKRFSYFSYRPGCLNLDYHYHYFVIVFLLLFLLNWMLVFVFSANPAPPPAFSAGQPLLPYPGPAYAPPPHSSELVQPPYNPTYVPTS